MYQCTCWAIIQSFVTKFWHFFHRFYARSISNNMLHYFISHELLVGFIADDAVCWYLLQRET